MVEIESCVKSSLPEIKDAAVDVVELPTLSKQLVAFVCFAGEIRSPQSNTIFATLMELLGEMLPSYMTPSLFLPLSEMPKLDSREVDRDELRRIALHAPAEQLVNRSTLTSLQTRNDPHRTELEILLQGLWDATLGVETSSVNRDTSFLALGGDSLRAMQLVAAATEEGY